MRKRRRRGEGRRTRMKGKKGESERGQEETSIAILDQEILRPKKNHYFKLRGSLFNDKKNNIPGKYTCFKSVCT